ncbi:LysR family transcriptional regulator [Kordiimonas aquimaris]|uniref:LysR family transcriptional regulator n=1 Tax=Kordiimonas aquimaris TaxID=707591 RepID=UPI0021D3E6DD|nr:LysR family transcriptional regulator [Kordiimonas aquimaris]
MNWDDLRILESCARNGSFLRASEELGLSHSSISRRMTHLENDLKITLLNRTPGGITLTDAGLSIAAQANDMAAAALIVKNTTENTARLSGRIHFETIDSTAFNLMGYLNEFTLLHPDVEIDLHLNQNMVDLARGDADVVLRATNDPTQDYVGHHVADHAFGIFGSVDLINRYPPDTPLNDLPWVLWGNSWTDEWMKQLGLNPRVAMRVSTAFGMVQAMRAGIGIGHMACWAVAQDEGFLCLRAPDEKRSLQIWILAHQSMRRNQRVKTFMRFLRQKIVADRKLIEGGLGSPTRPLNRPLI